MTKTRTVHQLLAGFSRRDAISNEARLLRDLFRRWGLASEIYCDPACTLPELRPETRDPAELPHRCGPADIAFLHLSIGSDINDLFPRLPCRKVILYHNITPAAFLEGVNPETAARLRRGRDQLRALAGTADLVLADSSFNAAELREAGYGDVHVLPLLLDLSEFGPVDRGFLRAYSDGVTNLVFVGRCAPNKRLDHLIILLYYYRTFCQRDARLLLAGSYAGTEKYHALLLALARRLGLDDAVRFLGSIPQPQLNALYRCAHLFVSMSEHEGFCVPILEAMFHSLPVMAYAAGAVPETMGDAGVLFRRKDFPLLAETAFRLVRDTELRSAVVRRQDRRVAAYDPQREAARLRELLEPLLR